MFWGMMIFHIILSSVIFWLLLLSKIVLVIYIFLETDQAFEPIQNIEPDLEIENNLKTCLLVVFFSSDFLVIEFFFIFWLNTNIQAYLLFLYSFPNTLKVFVSSNYLKHFHIVTFVKSSFLPSLDFFFFKFESLALYFSLFSCKSVQSMNFPLSTFLVTSHKPTANCFNSFLS